MGQAPPPHSSMATELDRLISGGSASIGGYEVQQLLNTDSLTRSYLVSQSGTDRLFALKTVETGQPAPSANAGEEDAEARARAALSREAKILEDLRLPGIPALEHYEGDGDQPFLLIRYQEGETLEKSVKNRGRPVRESKLRQLLASLIDTLDAVHGAGYLHRDIKPSNILLTPDGRTLLLDFGAALSIDAALRNAGGETHLTPGFAAPEQYTDHDPEGPWTDVYGLAATLYWIVAGSAPPAAPDRAAGEDMPPARELGRDSYPEDLLSAIDRGLAMEIADRPQSVDVLNMQAGSATATSAPSPGTAVWEPVVDDCPPTERLTRVPASAKAARQRRSVIKNESHVIARSAKRKWQGLWVAGLVVLFLAAAAWPGWQAYLRYFKQDWIVDASGGGDTMRIGEALAIARDGAVLHIRPGTYPESLSILRPVTLIGETPDQGKPVIAPPVGPCLDFDAPQGTLRGLSFERTSGSGDETPCVVSRGGSLTLLGSVIRNVRGAGLLATGGAQIAVDDTMLVEIGGQALILEGGAAAKIEGTRIIDSAKAGMVVRGGAILEANNSSVEGAGQAGIVVEDGSLAVLSGNTIRASKASGLEIRRGGRARLAEDIIEGNQGAGVYIYESGRVEMSRVVIAGNGHSGVIVSQSSAVSIADSEIRANREHGVVLMNGTLSTVQRNQISQNGGHGILYDKESDIELAENRTEQNSEPQELEANLKGDPE